MTDPGRINRLIYMDYIIIYCINMSFAEFLQNIEQDNAGDIVCLVTQGLLTTLITINLYKNWDQFPIKQLSPLCTLSVLLNFFLINIISFIAKVIEQSNHYYDPNYSSTNCGQCRLYDHPEMLTLAVIYTGLREFSLFIFSLKTLRVCICFLFKQDKQLHKVSIAIFSKQANVVLISLGFSALVAILNFLSAMQTINPSTVYITFEFFCPKEIGILQLSLTVIRLIIMSVAYVLCLKTYKQLDFKRFLFIIFLLNNTQVLVRLLIIAKNIGQQTYHQFYYHSMLLHLISTIVLYPYSQYNQYVNQPPSEAILQNFDAFINYSPGSKIIKCFAEYLDQGQGTNKNTRMLQKYIQLVQIRKDTFVQPNKILRYYSQIEQIIESEIFEENLEMTAQINKKLRDKILKPQHLKKIQNQLRQYCDREIYKKWKKTQSREYISLQFRDNIVIDSKMRSLNIEIGNY